MKHTIRKILALCFVFAFFYTSFAVNASAKAEPSMPKVSVEGQSFIDEHGRTRIFNGLNYGIGKQGPAEQLDNEWFAVYAAKGFNVLRLGLYWAEIEPEPGEYNQEYLHAVDAIFDAAAAHGVYIMLELHQDLYGQAAGGFGYGAPDWACLNDGAKTRDSFKYVWAEGYFWGKGVHRSFDNFWANKEACGRGLQDHYAALWAMMAERWGRRPAMLGYDFLNEPYPGTDGGKIFRSLVARIPLAGLRHPIKTGKLALSAIRGEKLQMLGFLDDAFMRSITQAADRRVRQFDEQKYTPFLEKMTSAIRDATPGGIVFMEHNYYSNLGVPYHANVPKNEKNMAYSPHGYDFMVDTEYYNNPSDSRAFSIFHEGRRAQQRLDVPVLVGEWGGEWGGKRWIAHCEALLDLFDSYGWSNAYYAFQWSWKWFDYIGCNFLARPYPMAVNGRDAVYKYDKTAGTFTLEYTQPTDFDPAQPTILYLPGEGAVKADGLTAEIVPLDHENMPGASYVYLTGAAGKHSVTVEFSAAGKVT